MQTVNEYMVRDLLTPLGGSGDLDEQIHLYRNIDNNNETEIKKIISNTIKPYFKKQTEEYQASAKRSLSYFLTTNRLDYGYVYDSCLIAFDHPDDARDFFLWIWEVLFPIENHTMTDIKKYTEIDDINEGNNYSQLS
jgi:hypothetical protein